MFTPGSKRATRSSIHNAGSHRPALDSPVTPLQHNQSIPNRPSTGTPAPWAPHLSVLARIPPAHRTEKENEVDPIKPVYVGEFPQVVRDEQDRFLQKHISGNAHISGGMDKDTCLSWIIFGNRLFIWSYLSSAASKDCIVLEFPSNVLDDGDSGNKSYLGSNWIVAIVNWEISCQGRTKDVQSRNSAGVIICNQKTRAVIYWPDIYSADGSIPVTSLLSTNEMENASSPSDNKTTPTRKQQPNKPGSISVGSNTLNSMIASAVSVSQQVCVSWVCSSNGELWQFYCSPTGIQRSKVYQDIVSSSFRVDVNGQSVLSKGYPRSLIWHSSFHSKEDVNRQFLMLTDQEIQCYSVTFRPALNVSKLWSHEIVSIDGDSGIQKDLAGQKRIWPLDVQVDDQGKVITILVATFCKDRVSGSSYIQYSLLTMQYKSTFSTPSDVHERILEKKAPIQVIIPKARVEDEDFLFSMRLRVGGRPSGSTIILSGDGTATVSHYYRNSLRLYQFDLPYDAGKVLDASILPSADGSEDGAWVVLTEKAGIWAIPEKAVVLGGVEPPERSLSRKGSSNEGSADEEGRNITFASNAAPRRASSEAWNAGGRQNTVITGIARRTAQDEESEALLGQLFHDFLLTGHVDASFVKLQKSGAFERDGETNVFTRTSKSIVDTLAKHWTTTRGAEIVALTIVSSQLIEKQQKHERYLQFLALSKCHEELCSKQRQSLQTILEHGEKLAGMIQIRELQNVISQNRSTASGSQNSSSESQIAGALWDLIQLVGERSRRNTVLLMDRDNAEVFYSKVSDLEEVFNCLERHLEYVVSEEQPLEVQIQRSCELSNAVVSVVRTAMLYRDDHHMWYPPPEGLTPWYCQLVVRNGLWRVASFMLQLLNEITGFNNFTKSDLYSHLEILAEVLLEAYAGAINAKLERGEDHKGLLEEYWNRRDFLLGSLYQKLKDYVEGGHQVFSIGTDEQNDEILRKLSSSLLSTAKRHEGYKTMWSICCDLNDAMLLKNLMHDSMGPKGGFNYFVFKQLYRKRQFSKLLRLGEEFPEELSFFLKHHHDLLWLHEVYLHQFSSTSETLHDLALSQDECSISEAEEGAEPDHVSLIKTPVDRKRLLHLSKIAAMAGKNADCETKLKRIDADLKILKLQEEILEVRQANSVEVYDGQQLLRPEELIEHCLNIESPELALRAFDVFAWTSSSFRQSHKSLLEECWKNGADQDDWAKLHQASINEGWTDDETLQQLRDTVLFQASSRCYGPRAETIEGGFDEVLPLRKKNLNVSETAKDSDISVEAILMQHKDFPDAGKLMLTAVMLGSVQDDVRVEETPSPME
ncbi:nuclear pore complex protein NUP133 isoform X2 [Mercurialis annua]|uniref:nuclear pore complex protein NUP133 isoform X2 n=1 Tax=Mercurialis annua TaxID=3986 RepID=UPI00215FCB4A|nr:nuclear pore complex protein NUP133 isoform X2 [Mercurialis annua]